MIYLYLFINRIAVTYIKKYVTTGVTRVLLQSVVVTRNRNIHECHKIKLGLVWVIFFENMILKIIRV